MKRALLCSSVLAFSGMSATSAFADACTATTVTNTASSTICKDGSSTVALTYPTSNPFPYTTGDFALTLDNHDVDPPSIGITFQGVTGGNGTITLQNGSDVLDSINATANGSATTVNVNSASTVTGFNGIFVQSSGAGGNVTVNTEAGTSVTGGLGFGINASTMTTGNVKVNALGAVSSSAGDFGILAQASSGATEVTTGTGAIGAVGWGIFATAQGTVRVKTGSGDVTGTNQLGIFASSTIDAVEITTGTGKVTGKTAGISAQGVAAANVETHGGVSGLTGIIASSGNSVEVTTVAVDATTTVSGTNGDGINATTVNFGTVKITNAVIAQGTDTGVEATSAVGQIEIINDNLIRNASALATDLAIRTATTTGATLIDNNVTILGRVLTGAGADVLTNDGDWRFEGTSDFSDGSDTVTNNKNIFAGGDKGVQDTTAFSSIEKLNNNGSIILRDQVSGDGSNISDRFTTSGDYAAGPNGGTLVVDAFLGGAGSLADVLVINGTVTGVTSIVVNDTNPGTGEENQAGILVVDVGTASAVDASNFVLAGGPIRKGLFVYDLTFDDLNNDFFLVSSETGLGFVEMLAVVASNQEIWRETADAWSTRQENLRDVLATSYGVTAVADPPIESSTAPVSSLWASAFGSWTERDDDGSMDGVEIDASYSQDVYGIVGGADFRTEVSEDTSLLFGVMGAYVDSSVDFDNSPTSINTDGATVGAYVGLLSRGFFATLLVKADLLDMKVEMESAEGDDTDVTTIGARGDFGYRFGDEIFVEPMISVDAMSTDIDSFEIDGAEVDAGTNESFRAAAGLRVGYGGETIRASATARVWNVFATDNEVDVAGLGLSDDDLEGVYGDVSGQVDINLTTNTTVYVKGGVLFSDDVTSPNASGGFAFYW